MMAMVMAIVPLPTFAGSGLYISEMFQHTYTYKTDVWSAVRLCMCCGRYPAANFAKALIYVKESADLRTLPNIPDNMPGPFTTC
jgi:hypothetical protein